MQEAAAFCENLVELLRQWELRRLLGGPFDENNAILTVLVRAARGL